MKNNDSSYYSPLQAVHYFGLQNSQRMALQTSNSPITYRYLSFRIDLIAKLLNDSGVSNIGIWLENGEFWVASQLAAFQLGITVTPIPTFFSKEQICHVVLSSGMDAIVSIDQEAVLNLDVGFFEDKNFTRVIDGYKLFRRRADLTPIPRGTALVTFTSGSTGTPKGVCLSLKQIEERCRSLATVINHEHIHRHLCLIPLAVLLENLAGVLLPLFCGATSIICGSDETGIKGSTQLDIPKLCTFLNAHPADSLVVTPELLKVLIVLKSNNLITNSFKFIAVGGGCVSTRLLKEAEELGFPIYQGYGLSECASVVTLNTPESNKTGTVGRALPGVNLKIAEDGEVLVSAPTMLGYIGDNPPKQKSDQWFPTGDIGHIDSDGFLSIDGRKKHLFINSFGRNYSPEWIESELLALPTIKQACLIGDNRPYNLAIISKQEGVSDLKLKESIEVLNRHLPDYAQVQHWIFSTTQFSTHNDQLTANGRIRREPIYQAYEAQIEEHYRIYETKTITIDGVADVVL